ncbi:hypothetical protein C1645_879076 [Glomus cerebriforme]|uniref:F-box domain-containing protein n=1 Tax=Glomus cerebriforme TaxID=658196 RepID=A0A397SP39_9GLOM|nr:hypothetical protein C1645_879076 [Glomus cerebriforme]
MSQLPADCLEEIFEYLEDDQITLNSCLLINHLWCEVSVGILWKKIRNFNTLIECMSNESKEILHRNGIFISTLTLNPPMFNYASFCKFLSVDDVYYNIRRLLKETSISSEHNIYVVSQEIFKLLMSQITSLKKLTIFDLSLRQNTTFTSYPGAKNCLRDLSELHCRSNVYHEFFDRLSQICHNIQILYISFKKAISNGLMDLISAQQNLKCLIMEQFFEYINLGGLITKIPNTLTKLDIFGGDHYIPLSFISKLSNLQELVLSFYHSDALEDFKILQYINFPQLKSLKFRYKCPSYDFLIKFLEINGRNLKELYISESNDSLNSIIIEFCPNLRKLYTEFTIYELETLKMLFNNCKYLESIKIYCKGCFSEKDLFEIIAKYSPKTFHELELNYSYNSKSELLPEELESFFMSWANRIPHKPLSLIIVDDECSFEKNEENMKIIEKYIKLGVVRNLNIKL